MTVRLEYHQAGETLTLYAVDGVDPVPDALREDVCAILRATLERVQNVEPSDMRDPWAFAERDAEGRVSVRDLRRMLLNPQLTADRKVAAAAFGGFPVERVAYEPNVKLENLGGAITVSRWTVATDWFGDRRTTRLEGVEDFGHPDRGGPAGVEHMWQLAELTLLSDLAEV